MWTLSFEAGTGEGVLRRATLQRRVVSRVGDGIDRNGRVGQTQLEVRPSWYAFNCKSGVKFFYLPLAGNSSSHVPVDKLYTWCSQLRSEYSGVEKWC
jgi:hypothetical protein